VRRIRDCIKRRKIDLVHAHGYKSNIYAYAAARPSRVPLVATCHNWPGKTISLRLYYKLDHLLLRRFDRIAAVSTQVVESLRRARIPASKICLVANGIDVSCFANSTASRQGNSTHSNSVRIGTVGRLVPDKGVRFLLLAAREILNRCPKTEFHVIGEGPERPELELLAGQLGIEKEVVFLGAQSDMPSIYASFDIFVLPSLNEGMPLSLLEAMAAGKPAVATRVGAISSLVLQNQTGLLVEPRDTLGLRDAVLRLIYEPGLRLQIGRAGQRFVSEQFSARAMAGNYLKLYQELVDHRAAA
jgi:glycosyltransferase involved in cell wall biosynthesis